MCLMVLICFIFVFVFFSEIGPGWMPAILESRAERVFVKESQKLLSDIRTYWIGGNIKGMIN